MKYVVIPNVDLSPDVFSSVLGKNLISSQIYESFVIKLAPISSNTKCITWKGETENEYFAIHYIDGKFSLLISEREMMLPYQNLIILGKIIPTSEDVSNNPDVNDIFTTIMEYLEWKIKDPSKINDAI